MKQHKKKLWNQRPKKLKNEQTTKLGGILDEHKGKEDEEIGKTGKGERVGKRKEEI